MEQLLFVQEWWTRIRLADHIARRIQLLPNQSVSTRLKVQPSVPFHFVILISQQINPIFQMLVPTTDLVIIHFHKTIKVWASRKS